MRRDLRHGKVLIDWSQNHPAKTTVAPYSVRIRAEPWVSTPISWDEVDRAAETGEPELLKFGLRDVLARVASVGDLFEPLVHEEGPGPQPPGG
jgi:bifunctional non-homologous end joining protein LigD